MAKAEKGVSAKKIRNGSDILFERAKEARDEPELSARYVSLARRNVCEAETDVLSERK